MVRSRAELAVALAPGLRVFVPTMGALHAGHEALIHRAREAAGPDGQVVVSIFVNPLQFDQAADLAAYPATSEADLVLARRAGADLVWLPGVTDVYPQGVRYERCEPGPLGEQLEGTSRPGHFAGMLTVVNLMFELVSPRYACFGEKDYQQLVLVRRLVAERGLPVEIIGVPTVRDPDGLALSSRNRRLSVAGREQALAIPRAMAAARRDNGDVAARLARSRKELADLTVDYLECRDPDLGPAPNGGSARILVAAVIEGVRLIDNVRVHIDAATRFPEGWTG